VIKYCLVREASAAASGFVQVGFGPRMHVAAGALQRATRTSVTYWRAFVDQLPVALDLLRR
jgi:hypothetical protein